MSFVRYRCQVMTRILKYDCSGMPFYGLSYCCSLVYARDCPTSDYFIISRIASAIDHTKDQRICEGSRDPVPKRGNVMPGLHVVIVGAGVAGLTCSITLARHKNVKVTVIEKYPSNSQVHSRPMSRPGPESRPRILF